MAALSESDLRVMVGPDYERILKSSAAVSATSTPEEHAESRLQREKRLADMNFTFYALMFTGLCLTVGGLYSGSALISVQGLTGVAFIVVAIAGLIFNGSRSRAIVRETRAAESV